MFLYIKTRIYSRKSGFKSKKSRKKSKTNYFSTFEKEKRKENPKYRTEFLRKNRKTEKRKHEKRKGRRKKRKEETRKTKIKLFLLYIMPVVLVFFIVLYSRAIFSHVFAVFRRTG